MKKVYCIGEMLIDMVGVENRGLIMGEMFAKKEGGAPYNVACTIKKLGGESFFLGQIGSDDFGKFLDLALEREGVGRDYVSYGGNTTLAFVSLDENGERSFSFIRGSDREYDLDEKIINELVRDEAIFHFGGATAFLGGPLERSCCRLFAAAKREGKTISFDPNYRDTLIRQDLLPDYRQKCLAFMADSSLIKMSEEEACLLFECRSLDKALKKIKDLTDAAVLITLGADGSRLVVKDHDEIVPSIKVNQIDATGAGDAFAGAVLARLAAFDNTETIKIDEWRNIVRYGNIAGAITCQKHGANVAFNEEDIKRFL